LQARSIPKSCGEIFIQIFCIASSADLSVVCSFVLEKRLSIDGNRFVAAIQEVGGISTICAESARNRRTSGGHQRSRELSRLSQGVVPLSRQNCMLPGVVVLGVIKCGSSSNRWNIHAKELLPTALPRSMDFWNEVCYVLARLSTQPSFVSVSKKVFVFIHGS
jgi:hypothetical protein